MGRNTDYGFPSGNWHIEIEGLEKRPSFWRRTVPVWQAALFLTTLALLFTLTFWATTH